MFAKLRGRVRIAALGLALVACNADRLVAPSPIATPGAATGGMARLNGSAVVISQVYGGGGNNLATYNYDYVELFNTSAAPVAVGGWKLHYGSATGTTWNNTASLPAAAVIEPGQYYLVRMATNNVAVGSALPGFDAEGGINLSGSAGKLVLTSEDVPLSGACPSPASIVDRVAFGSASGTSSCITEWGTRTASLSNQNAAFRKDDGCTDTNVAGSDFSVAVARARWSGSPRHSCARQASITLNPASPSVPRGSTIAFTATGTEADGTPITDFAWASSDETVATIDGDGVVTARTAGATVISATHGSTVGSTTLTVTVPVGAIALSPTSAEVVTTQTRQLTATVFDVDGAQIVPTPTLSWSSSNTSVATVSGTGLVTGKGEGTATITAAIGGQIATATINVADGEPGVVASISVSSNTAGDPNVSSVPQGYARKFFATPRDAFGNPVTGATLTWTANQPGIRTFTTPSTTTGYVQGITAGSGYSFTVSSPNGVTRTWTAFTVTDSTPSASAVYANQLELGTPADADASDDIVIVRQRSAFSYSAARGGPNWVSWTITQSQFGTAPRCDCWIEDDQLPAGVYRVTDDDYTGGGYDRGHMVQSESRTASDGENGATFLTSNALPQAGPTNQGPWGQFENYLNDLARRGVDRKDVYVVAGGLWNASAPTLKNAGRVAIPDYTWKVAVIVNAGARLGDIRSLADLEVVAVKMPNRLDAGAPPETDATGVRNTPWESFRVTVDALEAATGYNVLDLLPDEIEAPVEAGDRHAPTIILDAPVTTITEGGAVMLDASQSRDADGDAISYAWTLGGDTLSTSAVPMLTFADDGVKILTLTVRDAYGAATRQSVTITVRNAAPVATLASPTVSVVSGGTLEVTGGFSDAGAQDAPWLWAIDFGNGTAASGSAGTIAPVSRSATYLRAGSYTVTFQVTDKDGATGAAAPLVISVERLAAEGAVSPSVINPNPTGNGNVAFALLSQPGLDATTLDVASARIGTVAPILKNKGEWFTEARDVDGDGSADLVVRFDRGELVKAGALASGQEALVMTGDLRDGRQVKATAQVAVR